MCGLSIDFSAVFGNFFWMAASVAGLIAIKAGLLTLACLAFGKPLDVAVRVGVLMGAGGEFAFIIIGSAMGLGVIPDDTAQFMAAVTALSMAATPFLPTLGEALAKVLRRRAEGEPGGESVAGALETESADLESHVLIAGYGRVGQTAAKLLRMQKTPYIALDMNGPRVREHRARGEPVYFGDASRLDVLRRAGANRAAAFLVTLDDASVAARTVEAARQLWPDLPIYVRSKDDAHTQHLLDLGATCVVPEALESSLQLSGQLLQALGYPVEAVHQLMDQVRIETYAGASDAFLGPREPSPEPVEAKAAG